MTEIVDVPERSAFEIRVDGQPAGYVTYRREGNRRVFVHTEMDPAFAGQGLGAKLAAGALDATRTAGERIVSICPFITKYLAKHPEYAAAVDQA